MKSHQYLLLLFIIGLAYACNFSNHEKTQLIEEMKEEGFDYIGPAPSQNGIWDTLLIGYSDRENGIFHNKSERFETLEINGYEFEKTANERFKKSVLIFSFTFNDAAEKVKFENFQKYMINYQQHSKNQVEFYEKNETWFLRFGLMP
jgi:hypothetical protein